MRLGEKGPSPSKERPNLSSALVTRHEGAVMICFDVLPRPGPAGNAPVPDGETKAQSWKVALLRPLRGEVAELESPDCLAL